MAREEGILLDAYRRARTLNGPQIIITKRFYYRVKLITRPATPPFRTIYANGFISFCFLSSFGSFFSRVLFIHTFHLLDLFVYHLLFIADCK